MVINQRIGEGAADDSVLAFPGKAPGARSATVGRTPAPRPKSLVARAVTFGTLIHLARRNRAFLLWLLATVAFLGASAAATPRVGLDPSWITGVNLAFLKRLHHGSDIVFTYGPWGFLETPLILNRTQFAFGVVFSTVANVAYFSAVYAAVSRFRPAKVAAPVAFLVCGLTTWVSLRFLGAAIVLGVLILRRRARTGHAVAHEAGVGAAMAALSAAFLQIKFSEGLAWCALTAVVVVFVTSWRALARNVSASVPAFAVTTAVLWLAAGQRPGDFLPWLRGSWQLSSGYQEALATEQSGRLLSYGFAAVLAILVVTLAVHAGRRAGLVLRLGFVAYALLLLEFGFKHGFTRHDVGHEPTFFVVASCLLLALAATTRAPLKVTAAASVTLFVFSATPQAFDAFGARGAWYSSLSTLVDPRYQAVQLKDARAKARHHYRLPATMLSEAKGHPVQVDVWETSAVWAYSLQWRPVPVFQMLSAYTPYLDDLNARAITEAPADQVVLRQAYWVKDDHNPRWETPSYLMALACNYRVSSNEGAWSMLVHAQNRCSAPRTLGSLRVQAGQRVAVPKAGPREILVARFAPAPRGIAGKAQQAILKDWKKLMVTTDHGSFRLPEGLSGGPLMISIPTDLGWPAPFEPGSHGNLTFNKAGTLTYEVVQLR